MIYNMILLLLITFMIASITLLESKMLSLVQSSIGPNMIGYNGRLQFIADALKLLGKGIFMHKLISKVDMCIYSFFLVMIIYMFWANLYIEKNILMMELEFSIMFLLITSMLFSLSVIFISFYSKNKYTILAGLSFIMSIMNNEILNGFLMVTIMLFNFSFSMISFEQLNLFLIFNYSIVINLIFITFFIEVGSTPFDFGESESELIAGYTTELSGFMFVLYYLGEYFHLLMMSNIYTLIYFNTI